MRLNGLVIAICLALALVGCKEQKAEDRGQPTEDSEKAKKAEDRGQPTEDGEKAEEPKAEEPKAEEPKAEEQPDNNEPRTSVSGRRPTKEAAKGQEAEDPSTPLRASSEQPTEDSAKVKKYDTANPVVLIETSMGSFAVELFPDKTPKTVENFLRYVNDEFYDKTIFHRVVKKFVIQGGGFLEDLAMMPTLPPVENEAATGLDNVRGTIAMARTKARHSANAQFFVNLKNNGMLNYSGESPGGWGYTAFGKVIEGMDVVDAIGSVPTGPRDQFPRDVPTNNVVIKKARAVQ